jgi:hypothetical protein
LPDNAFPFEISTGVHSIEWAPFLFTVLQTGVMSDRERETVKQKLLAYYAFNENYQQQSGNGTRSNARIEATKRLKRFKPDEAIPDTLHFVPGRTKRILNLLSVCFLVFVPLLLAAARTGDTFLALWLVAILVILVSLILWRPWLGKRLLQTLELNSEGIVYCDTFYAWQDIVLTHIVQEYRPYADSRLFLELGMLSGDICRCDVTRIDFVGYWKALTQAQSEILGHYIEVFKSRHQDDAN